MQFGRVDLLKGNIAKALGRLAAPIMGASVIQMAYSLIDMIWIGAGWARQRSRPSEPADCSCGLRTASCCWPNRRTGSVRAGGLRRTPAPGPAVYSRRHSAAFCSACCTVCCCSLPPSDRRFFPFQRTGNDPDDAAVPRRHRAGHSIHLPEQNSVRPVHGHRRSRTLPMVTAVGLICNMRVLDPLAIFTLGWGRRRRHRHHRLTGCRSRSVHTGAARGSVFPQPQTVAHGAPGLLPAHHSAQLSGQPAGTDLFRRQHPPLPLIASHGDSGGRSPHRRQHRIHCLAQFGRPVQQRQRPHRTEFRRRAADRARKGYRTALWLPAIAIGSLTTALLFCLPRELMTILSTTPSPSGSARYLRITSYSQVAMYRSS